MYSTQPYHDPSFLKEVWGLFGFGMFVILLRMLVRIRTVGLRWQGDDYMAVAVLLCYTVDAVTVTLCYQYGTNVDFAPGQLAAMSAKEQSQVVLGSRMQLLAWYTYTGLVWGLKATMLFFFNRLTFGLAQQRFVKILGIAVGATYAAVFLTITLGCYPTRRNWQLVPYPGEVCTFKAQNFYVSTILNVITDAALLAVPLPLMWALQVPLKKKIGLCLLLSSGVFVISAAIIRIVMTLVAHPSALTINRWGVRETIAGIVAVNVPIIKPVFTKAFWTKNFPPRGSDIKSIDRKSPAYASETGDSNRRTRILSSMRGKVDAFEMTDKTPSQDHDLAGYGKDFGGVQTIVEVESNSDIHNPTSNRSSEDLVAQCKDESLPPYRSEPRQQRTTFEHEGHQQRDLEVGSPSQSSQRMEVRVDQFYDSHQGMRPGSTSNGEWESDSPYGIGWPRRGFGNRVTVEGAWGTDGGPGSPK